MSNSAQVSNRAWLVSETVPTPDSGRIAISLACRAAALDEESPHRLRVAIEGIDRNGPFKRAVELGVPRSGQWQPRRVVLEVDGIDPKRVDKLRLTLDSLSSGRIWIDDVHFHDWFPTAAERSELRSQAYLAVQGLQRANLTAASRLLQNFWAGELLADFDPTAEAEETGSGGEPTAGMAARIREWLPQTLRF